MLWRTASAFEQYTAVPFFPFTEALMLTPAGAPLLPQAEALERWPELAHLISEGGSDAPRRNRDDEQLRVFRAATGFLHALAGTSPLVLLLEDLHWADATSLGLLLYLVRHLADARILILGTYRDHELGPAHPLEETLRELVRERIVDEVHVRPLAVDGTAALVRAQLAAESVSDELVGFVHGRAEGNPFFTEELLKTLVERGALSQVQGHWERRTQGEIENPRSLRTVVSQRVCRLPPDAQALLRLASVVGQEFDLDVLLAVIGQPESPVLDQVDAALGAGLLRARRGGNVERYYFAHALIHLALYEELPSHRLRRLHRRVGETLEALQEGQPGVAAQLARHFLAAGDGERATHYSIDAGDNAAVHYAHAEAARHYQVAVDLLLKGGHHARAVDVQYRLASELYDLNRLTEALAVYETTLITFEGLEDTTGQAFGVPRHQASFFGVFWHNRGSAHDACRPGSGGHRPPRVSSDHRVRTSNRTRPSE